MLDLKLTPRKIGKLGSTLLALLVGSLAYAADVQFSAEVESSRININDTVGLKMTIRSQGGMQVEEPGFEAPDFQISGEFSSLSVSSRYDSTAGRFSSVNTQQLTKLLKPTRLGTLKITKIQLNAGGKILKAPDIVIQVSKAGSVPPSSPQNAPNPSLGQNLSPNIGGAPPRQKKQRISGSNAIVRAEINKTTPYYKGEQVVVSYYLYHQMRVFNVQVEKFPVLNGFLREDLEVPVMGQRLESEPTELNGVLYERSLLAQYAAYPLEEGKMDIDSISLKFNFYPNSNNMFEEEDPFFGFFQQMVPRIWTGRNDPLSIQVLPLPEEGRPKSFTGGVGDFNIISAVDKYEVHANDAVTLTVKVEGRGNVSTIQVPKAAWPDSIELYDSKGKTQSGRQGVGQKVFEFLLIPRAPGKLTLPPLEFGFFDPVKKQYYVKSTEPVDLQVLDPAPGTSLVPLNRAQSQSESQSQSMKSTNKPEMRDLKPPSTNAADGNSQPLWRLLYLGFFAGLGILVLFLGLDWVKRKKEQKGKSSASLTRQQAAVWERLQASARGATNGTPWQDITRAYETLTEEVFDALEGSYSVGVRSLSRTQLQELLVEQRGLTKQIWDRIVRLLEFSDTVRFASSAGVFSESIARAELSKWINEGQSLVRILERSSP